VSAGHSAGHSAAHYTSYRSSISWTGQPTWAVRTALCETAWTATDRLLIR